MVALCGVVAPENIIQPDLFRTAVILLLRFSALGQESDLRGVQVVSWSCCGAKWCSYLLWHDSWPGIDRLRRKNDFFIEACLQYLTAVLNHII